jgi:hypothetical protein
MYERKENIEEENLDWGEDLEKIEDKIIDDRHIIHPDSKEKKIIFINRVNADRKLNIKKSITNLSHEYSEITLVLSILILPYMMGFVVSYLLFYIYGGMSIGNFLNIEKGNLHFELWSIGAYFFVTVGVIGTVIAYLKDR